MGQEDNTKRVGMEYLNDLERVNYSDGDILILDNLEGLRKAGSMEMELVLIVICQNGIVRLDHNGTPITFGEKDMLICPPGVYLDNITSSQDFRGVIFALSYQKFLKTVCSGLEIWSLLLYASKHPVFHLLDIDIDITRGYFLVVQKKIQTDRTYYYREIMHSLMEAIFYELCVVMNREIKPENIKDDSNQSNTIFRKFIELVAANGGKDRSVVYYAKALCITPKYLSSIAKSLSGKPALEWILGYTAEGIAHELRYSGKSIKEIANEYRFPTISSFGKFVKKRLGVSPREYRHGGNSSK